MKVKDMYPSAYIKATDLVESDQPEPVLQISDCTMEEMPAFEGEKPETRPVIGFTNSDKRMVLNQTNASMIAFLHGEETDAWQGKLIQLHTQPVAFKGVVNPAIRVKDTVPSGQTTAVGTNNDSAPLPF
jgi:hypothetical protein